jgi:EpsI family protein
VVFVAAAALLGLPPAAAALLGGAPAGHSAAALPAAAAPWVGPTDSQLEWRPRFPGAARVLRGRYARRDGSAVEVAAVVFTAQREGAELVSDANELVPGDDWALVSRGTRDAGAPADTGPSRVGEWRMTGRQGDWHFWSWYVIDDEVTASDTRAKLLQAWRTITGRGSSPTGLIAVAATSNGRDDAAALLREFLSAHGGRLGDCATAAVPQADCIER